MRIDVLGMCLFKSSACGSAPPAIACHLLELVNLGMIFSLSEVVHDLPTPLRSDVLIVVYAHTTAGVLQT